MRHVPLNCVAELVAFTAPGIQELLSVTATMQQQTMRNMQLRLRGFAIRIAGIRQPSRTLKRLSKHVKEQFGCRLSRQPCECDNMDLGFNQSNQFRASRQTWTIPIFGELGAKDDHELLRMLSLLVAKIKTSPLLMTQAS